MGRLPCEDTKEESAFWEPEGGIHRNKSNGLMEF